MLRNSRELRAVLEAMYPFDADGNLLPLEKRCTLLASNANFALEVQLRGMVMASAAFKGSPQIVQISYTATDQTGSHPKKLKPIEGVRRNARTRPAAVGAQRAAQMLEWIADDYDADLIWMSLDHYTSPKFSVKAYAEPHGCGGIYEPVARALLEDAIESIGCEVSKPEFTAYVNYLTSDEFGEYARDFFGSVALGDPAWAMIDTGATPAAVNLASSKWLIDGVRTGQHRRHHRGGVQRDRQQRRGGRVRLLAGPARPQGRADDARGRGPGIPEASLHVRAENRRRRHRLRGRQQARRQGGRGVRHRLRQAAGRPDRPEEPDGPPHRVRRPRRHRLRLGG
jgi:hypothetical protein